MNDLLKTSLYNGYIKVRILLKLKRLVLQLAAEDGFYSLVNCFGNVHVCCLC